MGDMSAFIGGRRSSTKGSILSPLEKNTSPSPRLSKGVTFENSEAAGTPGPGGGDGGGSSEGSPDLDAASHEDYAHHDVDIYHEEGDVMVVFNAIRNGIFYGTRIRFVDAVIKSLLYSDKNIFSNYGEFYKIVDATFYHGCNLGLSLGINKVVLMIMRRLNGGVTLARDWAIAGFFGGLLVWGNDTRFK